MREVKIRQSHVKRSKYMGRYLLLVLAIAVIFLGGVIYSTMVVKATDRKSSSQEHYKYFTEVLVGRDDTLWDIANNYISDEYDSVDDYLAEVREINSIFGNRIYYGQRLMVPYYSDEIK